MVGARHGRERAPHLGPAPSSWGACSAGRSRCPSSCCRTSRSSGRSLGAGVHAWGREHTAGHHTSLPYALACRPACQAAAVQSTVRARAQGKEPTAGHTAGAPRRALIMLVLTAVVGVFVQLVPAPAGLARDDLLVCIPGARAAADHNLVAPGRLRARDCGASGNAPLELFAWGGGRRCGWARRVRAGPGGGADTPPAGLRMPPATCVAWREGISRPAGGVQALPGTSPSGLPPKLRQVPPTKSGPPLQHLTRLPQTLGALPVKGCHQRDAHRRGRGATGPPHHSQRERARQPKGSLAASTGRTLGYAPN